MAFGYLSFINTSDEDSSTELIYARFKEKSDTCLFCSNNTLMYLVILYTLKKYLGLFLEILNLHEMTSLTLSIPSDL